MDQIVDFLIGILGKVMILCYSLLKDYGASIILFTLLTKALLFPINILTQRNSIRMVRLQPELDSLKIKYIDDKDKFTDEQLALYKKYKYNPFMDTLPLLIQIPIVLGLVGVVYRPLSYVLDLDTSAVNALNDWLTNTLGITDAGNLFQIRIIEQIKNGVLPNGIPQNIINRIAGFNTNFLGIDLGVTPKSNGAAKQLLIPFLSGASALLLCYAQNKINVLQMAQGKVNKILTTIFMVAFSTYFAFLVPAGVGLYWIFGNLFAIPLMMLTNAVMPPKKYIDYEQLSDIKRRKADEEERFRKNLKREKADYAEFFSVEKMQLMIYSEQNGFYKYYSGMIDYICEHSDIVIHYVTSDPEDRIFDDKREQIRAYYVASDRFLVPLFMKLDCDMCIMTMPDLEKYHIKRSKVRDDIEYVYLCHGMGSIPLTLRKGALDWYDTVLCVGPECEKEIRETERVYNTKPKTLVEAGYPLIDELISAYEAGEKKINDRPMILIAPSWQPDNIIESCIDELLDSLSGKGYDIILRPHPQMVRHEPELFERLHKQYDGTDVEVQTDFSSNSPILQADLLITDWSDISFEFAYTTKRPVLFINTPMKIMNPEYERIPVEPVNIAVRDLIGKSIEVSDVSSAAETAEELMNDPEKYRDNILSAMDKYLFNVGRSRAVYGRYVIKRLGR